MTRRVQLTVEFHGDPEVPDDVAQRMLDDVVDGINEVGYVSEVRWLTPREGAVAD